MPLVFVDVMPLRKVLLSLEAIVPDAEAEEEVEEGAAVC